MESPTITKTTTFDIASFASILARTNAVRADRGLENADPEKLALLLQGDLAQDELKRTGEHKARFQGVVLSLKTAEGTAYCEEVSADVNFGRAKKPESQEMQRGV